MEEWEKVSNVMLKSNIGVYYIACPGCRMLHPINTDQSKKPNWIFNGDNQNPTFNPSLVINQSNPSKKCHSFIRNGNIQFLSDCYHDLANKTVKLDDISGYWD